MKPILIVLGCVAAFLVLYAFHRRTRALAIQTLRGFVSEFTKSGNACQTVLEYYKTSLDLIGYYKFNGQEFGVINLKQYDFIARQSLLKSIEAARKRNPDGLCVKNLEKDMKELLQLQGGFDTVPVFAQVARPGMEAALSTL